MLTKIVNISRNLDSTLVNVDGNVVEVNIGIHREWFT